MLHEWLHPAAGSIKSLAVLPLQNLWRFGARILCRWHDRRINHRSVEDKSFKSDFPDFRDALQGTNQALPEIARQLNVDGVIEGSVERSGNG